MPPSGRPYRPYGPHRRTLQLRGLQTAVEAADAYGFPSETWLALPAEVASRSDLSPAARLLLGAALACGPDASTTTLGQVAGLNALQVGPALRELQAAGLLDRLVEHADPE